MNWSSTRRSRHAQSKKIYTPHELATYGQTTTLGWSELYYGNVESLIRLIQATTIVECGVAYGGHAMNLLNSCADIEYTGVDSYQHGYDNSDAFVSAVEEYLGMQGQHALDALYLAVVDRIEEFHGGRARLVREDSIFYANQVAHQSIDLVFLDDNHTFEYVSKELDAWWPTVRQGGILCGDDYWMPSVKLAVDNFAQAHDLSLRFLSKNEYKTYFFHK